MRVVKNSRLTSKERQELILDLCRALCTLRKSEEVAEALMDLLSPKEIETIAKRLKIAELLLEGEGYRSIREELKVGYSTIARVNTWLNLSGQGFKLLLTRRKKSPRPPSDEEKYDPLSWYNIKRRYSRYYWPELLLEELIRRSDQKERKKIKEIWEKMKNKKRIFSPATNKALYEMFNQIK